ncbi:MAG: aminotransferase class V-fold PLP-dependent enzyme [Brachybacterium sp.]|nr:aminotransferase class V-fold PLP-dependent enzyme [Brachybacterium sp.]
MGTAHVHAGWSREDPHQAVVPPIHTASAYAHSSHAALKDLFARRRDGFAYARSGNPTTAVLEERITALEGGIGAIAVSSGQAATTIALAALLAPGTHLVASRRLYGGTTEFLDDTLADLGVVTTTVDPWDLGAWEKAIRPETRAVLVEAIANPGAQLVDLPAIARIAHAYGVVVIVDSTLASPALLRPGDLGADVVVHSATKYLAGHGSVIAGLIVDTGVFDPRRDPARWPRLVGHNRRFNVDFSAEYARGGSGLLAYARAKYVTDLGATLSAHSAHTVLLGIETLDLRMRAISDTARELATWLAAQPGVATVHHPSIPGRPDGQLAERFFPRGTAGVFAIDLDGGEEAAAAFCDAAQLFTLAVNVGDVRSLLCHPATTTHSHLTPGQQDACGVGPGTIRLSIGLEDREDLRTDLRAALGAARALSSSARGLSRVASAPS